MKRVKEAPRPVLVEEDLMKLTYNELSRKNTPQRNLARNIIRRRYDKSLISDLSEMGVTREQVLGEIASIAFSDVEHSAIKLRALDMLARHLGLYEKDNAQRLANQQVLQIAFVGPGLAKESAELVEEAKKVISGDSDT